VIGYSRQALPPQALIVGPEQPISAISLTLLVTKATLDVMAHLPARFVPERKEPVIVNRPTEQTLLEQLQITEADIQQRQAILLFTADDGARLKGLRVHIETGVDDIVARFYEQLVTVEEAALLIGDADTLSHLLVVQRKYILDLFSGHYDLEYVHRRLRVGLVHKRIGVGPKLFLAAGAMLKKLLCERISQSVTDEEERRLAVEALGKLLLFDTTLIFETYIRSMVAEIALAKEGFDHNAAALEETVRQRTRELEAVSRTDPRTGLRNARYLEEFLTRAVRAAERRAEPLSLIFIDVDDFKAINDVHGHARGDEVLGAVGAAIMAVSRTEDGCFRYGGDEFCIVLPNCDEARARSVYCKRLQAEISARCADVKVSIGIAQTGPDDYADPAALLRRADERMYVEKPKKRKGSA
jgi:diguanylate cyclase